MKPHECDTMDSLEGSANDVITAEIDRRDQITQLLTALNRLMSTDRATPMLLISSILTPSIADITIGNKRWYNDGSRGVEEAPAKPSEVYRKA
ncbi:pol-like protein [Colletotrichum kahawae]|uniref:Pol-like protein n=1 Tax=Colletotrichum kahawae TaxID=34407 RepID=A0AAE0D3I1_COLKA|nr:pol-like protein [Colletotrichum kahawae]